MCFFAMKCVSCKNYLYVVKILLRREKRDLFDLSL